jgi:murein DD-endopeptidase MepM/ murein hydrolase activator NlpD
MMNSIRRSGRLGFLAMGCLLASLIGLACGGKAPDRVVVDPAQRLEPPGVYHRLLRGQTLYSLARAYGVPLGTLLRANGIQDPTNIPEGTPIFIPGAAGERTVPAPDRPAQSPRLSWPLRGTITARFGPRGGRGRPHEGIDIDGRHGDPIRAAASGVVKLARTGRGYGKMVVVDHGGGLTTLYAHASEILVRVGQRVRAGDRIARVGQTGNARGTHLHFEVHRQERVVNPLSLLGSR